MGMKARANVATFFKYFVLIFMGFIMVYPLLWMVGSTFKTNAEIFTSLSPFTAHPTLDGYYNAVTKTYGGDITIWRAFLNTYSYVIPKVVFTVISSVIVSGIAVLHPAVLGIVHYNDRLCFFMCLCLTVLSCNFFVHILFIRCLFLPALSLYCRSLRRLFCRFRFLHLRLPFCLRCLPYPAAVLLIGRLLICSCELLFYPFYRIALD